MDKYLRKRKVKTSFKEDIEPQEILLDSLAQKKEEELGLSEKKLEVPIFRRIIQGLLFISFILIFILFAKTFQLQVIEGENLTALAEGNKFKIYQIRAERGVIYDSQGNQLVYNLPSFDLILDLRALPQDEPEKLKVLKEVSKITKKDIKELEREIEKLESPQVAVAENLDHQTLILLETKISSKELPGFQIRQNYIRDYKEGSIFAHLIGYTGKIKSEELRAEPENYSLFDYVGREGVEKSYEKILRKTPGKLQVERDVRGNIISQRIIQLPQSGTSLALWLDSDLEKKISEELKKQLQLVGSQKGVAVALDPKTGGVLALVSLPAFDNNLFQKNTDPKILQQLLEDPQEPLFNRVIFGRYPTGSTIKPLIASAALQEKIISAEKKIYDPGFIEVPHRYDPEIVYKFEDWKVHGWTDLRKAIAESCNVYFYTVGGGYGTQAGLGPTKIKKYLELFGWGEKTQIDLPGKASGFIPDPAWKKETKKEGWWDGDTYLLSIGQGYLLITPLEVVNSFAAIANGGTLYQPQIVKEIVDSQRNLIEKIEPKIIRQLNIDPKNLQIVREGMREAVSSPDGSSYILNSLPVKAAAKTGTAQTPREGYYHNWVTVFAPYAPLEVSGQSEQERKSRPLTGYEDPQIVLTIMIENVRGVQAAALPVAKEVLEWYFSK